MTTVKELTERGYVRFKPSAIDNECVTDLYQKKFSDEHGIRYFITIKRWDMSRYNDALHKYEPSFEYTTQLYKKGSHAAVNVEFFDAWTLEEAEEYLQWMFESGKFDYYEEYAD